MSEMPKRICATPSEIWWPADVGSTENPNVTAYVRADIADETLVGLQQAVAMVEVGVINIRPSDRDGFLKVLASWNAAIAKAEQQ